MSDDDRIDALEEAVDVLTNRLDAMAKRLNRLEDGRRTKTRGVERRQADVVAALTRDYQPGQVVTAQTLANYIEDYAGVTDRTTRRKYIIDITKEGPFSPSDTPGQWVVADE